MELVVDALRSLGRQADGRDALDGQHAERGHHHRQQRPGGRQRELGLPGRFRETWADLGIGVASLKVVVIGDPYHQRDLSAPVEGPREELALNISGCGGSRHF